MNIKPLGDRILIEPLSEADRAKATKSGIIIPDTAGEKPIEGRVAAVGEGKRLPAPSGSALGGEKTILVPLSVKVGDKVLFSKYGPNEIKIGDKEYLIAKEEDILAIIE